MFTWQKHQHNYFQNYSFQTHLCLTWILVNEIEEILLICLIAFIYTNWHIDVGRLYNFKQFDLEKNNCYKGRFEEGVTEKLNINRRSIGKAETILHCLQHLIIGYCCTEGERALHSRRGTRGWFGHVAWEPATTLRLGKQREDSGFLELRSSEDRSYCSGHGLWELGIASLLWVSLRCCDEFLQHRDGRLEPAAEDRPMGRYCWGAADGSRESTEGITCLLPCSHLPPCPVSSTERACPKPAGKGDGVGRGQAPVLRWIRNGDMIA